MNRREERPEGEAGADRLLRLAKQFGTSWGDLDSGIARITEAASEALDVERVSVWFFNGDQSAIHCADLYDQSKGTHEKGAVLRAADCPAYFEAIGEARVLAAVDARTDPRTREFRDGYLDPLGITAMLDAPLWHAGRLIGVLCHEARSGPREWTDVDRGLAASLVDFLAMTLEANERRIAEETLRHREAELRAIVDNAHDAIASVDVDGRLPHVSPRLVEILGRPPEELVGDRWQAHVHPDDAEKLQWAIAHAREVGGPFVVTARWRRGDGTWRSFEARGRDYDDGSERRVVLVARDVTERLEAEAEARRLERQLVQAQKLEAVGRLAGGVAHDFNNILTAILGHAELALSDPQVSPTLREEIAEIQASAKRASDLTRQLLTLSSSPDAQPVPFDVDRAIEELTRMIRRVIGDEIECVLDLHGGGRLAFAEPARFDQVLVNLAINARDAMPGGGTLTISTGTLVIEAGDGEGFDTVPVGEYVRVDVRDTGMGIPDEIADRIFDPFFTTKAAGEGTGLGLAMVYGILRQAGGGVRVSSEEGKGTCFTLLLPIASAAAAATDAARHDARRTAASGGERILVVEDEPAIGRLFERIMTAEGYAVSVASNGAEGLARVRDLDQPFDLVISDVRMPDLGGPELAHHVRELRPGTPVLLVSGYAVPEDGSGATRVDGLEILAKPFSPTTLTARVREILDARG